MRQLWSLLFLCMVATSLFTASMAHARESVACVDSSSAVEMGHVDNDGDQVPADGDKSYPHHHAGCHGHQAAPQDQAAAPCARDVGGARLVPAQSYFLPAATADPALRPPQA